jgi:hypothetical protein
MAGRYGVDSFEARDRSRCHVSLLRQRLGGPAKRISRGADLCPAFKRALARMSGSQVGKNARSGKSIIRFAKIRPRQRKIGFVLPKRCLPKWRARPNWLRSAKVEIDAPINHVRDFAFATKSRGTLSPNRSRTAPPRGWRRCSGKRHSAVLPEFYRPAHADTPGPGRATSARSNSGHFPDGRPTDGRRLGGYPPNQPLDFFVRTPGWSPFVNSTPADSRAATIRDTVSARPPKAPSSASSRAIVGYDTPDWAAKSSWDHKSSARAAFICRTEIFSANLILPI